MANAIDGNTDSFDIFSDFKQIRIPVNDWAVQQMLALGMWYYKMLEKIG